MRKFMVAVAVAVTGLVAGQLFAKETAEQAEVLKVVNQMNDAFNKGDTKTVFALATDEMSIIDSIPPHEWHGPGAFAKWFADFDADAKKHGITDGTVTISKAKHVEVTGDCAYVVVAATLNYKQNGKPQKEAAAWTFALVKAKDGWRITGWAWAKS
jgi:ketosteroid isomerase-like protein